MQMDREELYLFLSMQPEIRSVRTDAAFAAILAQRWGTTAKTGSVMRLERDLPPDDRVQPPASPRSVYPLLAQCFEDGLSAFDSWYVDVSHRLRHGCCHMVVLSDAQGPAATAMTVAECHGAALLGCGGHPSRLPRPRLRVGLCLHTGSHHAGQGKSGLDLP